ncbi:uncharacterized protein LOC130927604 [Corythoichthys intestinalis]|uniref:uncharacterized protein LOC130927604 n=1 Tax=Corythoichthys intestinalis TaxID=161448 RepID=UPI0025A62023|nr:uncharacterized protein LOC130927604 [Corythoichthys intestinalis]
MLFFGNLRKSSEITSHREVRGKSAIHTVLFVALLLGKMPRRCVAMFCSHSNDKLFEWPKDTRARKWTSFVRTKRMNFTPSSSSVICYKHFEDACFLNRTAYDQGFAKKLLLNATAVPTIHLPPQDQQDQNPPVQRTAAATRERKRTLAEAISSAAAAEQEMAECGGTLLLDESCSNSHQDDEVTPTHRVDKMVQTLKYCPPCEKCKTRANYRSIGIQCNLGQPEPKRKKVCMPLVDTDSEEESDVEMDSQHLPDHDVEYIAGEDSDEDEPSSSDDEVTHDSFEEIRGNESEDLHKQRKYLVFESSLIALLAVCVLCKGRSTCYRYVKGTLVKIQAVCTVCRNKHQWCNQPFVRNLPVLNVLLSSAILFTGSLPSKALRIFRFLNIQCHNKWAYFHHQATYIHEALTTTWTKKQCALLGSITEKELVLGGDGRCDSMGHCAKYGSYNLMELDLNKVLTVHLVQSNETGGSYGMELEGLKRCRQELEGFNVKVVITDRHRQVAKWIRENWTQVIHYYDCWHIVKGMCKKLDSLGKKKSMSIVKDWVQSLKCHLYWCALSSQTPEEKKQKWLACVDHLQNVHDSCLHPPITTNKAWLLPGTEVNVAVVELLTKTMFVNDVMKMSHLGQTSGVETFHSVVNHFAPKMYHFSYKGMKSRIILAAMHYNENAGRPQKVTKEGIHSYCIVYPKYKSGGYSLRKILVDATYDYVNDCLSEVMKLIDIPKKHRTGDVLVDPQFLTAAVNRPDKSIVIAEHHTRFLRK